MRGATHFKSEQQANNKIEKRRSASCKSTDWYIYSISVSFLSADLFYNGWASIEATQKKEGMPVGVPSTRYSLVKGERIVRSVLST